MADVPSPHFVCGRCRGSSWTAVAHGARLLNDDDDAIAWRVVGTARGWAEGSMTFFTYRLCHVVSSVNLPRIPPRLHRSCQYNSALSGGNQHAIAYGSAQRHNGIAKANLELDHDANCSGPAATDMQFAFLPWNNAQTANSSQRHNKAKDDDRCGKYNDVMMIGKSRVKLMAMDFIIPHPSSRGDGRSSRRTKRSFTPES